MESKLNKGFTLVEIAIVLVIIGLLLGGVLKGQELMTNAKIKSVVKDLTGVSTAHYAYIDRYGKVAGDSDGDGKIDRNEGFWNDVDESGFIKKAVTVASIDPSVDRSTPGVVTFTSSFILSADIIFTQSLNGPAHKLNGIMYVQGDETLFDGGNFVCATDIEESYAQGVDTSLDDGDARTGSIRTLIDEPTPVSGTFFNGIPNATDNYTLGSEKPSHLCMAL